MYSESVRQMKIFLSHSSKDKGFVKKISKALESQGYQTWLDEDDILIGDDITHEIGNALTECDVVLVFLSRYSVQSRWVNREWQLKFFDQINKGHVYILPLLIEECSIPQLLRDKKYADFTKNESYETSLSLILQTLRSIEMTNEVSLKEKSNDGNIFLHTRELLDELEDEVIILPILGTIPIVDTLKKIRRSGKLVRLESFEKPKIKIRSIYDHTLSVAHLADCLLPVIKSGILIEKRTELARIIAFHEFNETILGDIPSYTNLKEKHRTSTANLAEQTLRSVLPEKRERIANELIWMFLSEKQRVSLGAVLEDLAQTQSNLTIFFKVLDKIDAIISVWRYLHYYRGKIEDIDEFLKRLKDFFEYPDVIGYISTTQYNDQVSDLIAVLQNRNYAKQYYMDSNFLFSNRSICKLSSEIVKKIIEDCPLFMDEEI